MFVHSCNENGDQREKKIDQFTKKYERLHVQKFTKNYKRKKMTIYKEQKYDIFTNNQISIGD